MATLPANPSTITSVQDRAGALDLIELELGRYPGSVFNRKGNLRYRAKDSYDGRAVEDGKGHLGAGFGVIITGPMNIGVSNVILDGCFHDTRDYTGINAGVFTGHNIELWNWSAVARPSGGARQIGYTLGSGTVRVKGFKFINGRHGPAGKVGESHDHSFYLKNSEGHLFRDSIIIDGGWFPLHFYTNGDDGSIENCIVIDGKYVTTLSGASDSSTGTSQYGTSDRNRFTKCIFGSKAGPSIQTWVSDSSRPVQGNVVEDNVHIPGVVPYQSSMKGVTIVSPKAVTPAFKDPSKGDFRMAAGSPAVGYGPRQIQPGYAGGGTPPPPPPPSDVTAPAITVVSPLPDEVVKGNLNYRANVLDDVAVKDVEFAYFPLGVPEQRKSIITETSAPYGETPFDTTKIPDGLYILEVVARDTSNNVAKQQVEFLVDNVPDTPPPPPPPTDAELHELLVGDFTAIENRLSTVETWDKLTDSQRQSVIEARNRAGIGKRRITG